MADNFVSKTIEVPVVDALAKFAPGIGSTDQYITKQIASPTTSLYLKADVYFRAADIAGMENNQSVDWNLLSISQNGESSPDESWHHLVINNGAGNLRFWDDLSISSERVEIQPDTWHEVELGIRPNGANYEFEYKIDGVASGTWELEGSINPGSTWEYIHVGCHIFGGGSFTANTRVFVNNVAVAQDNWVSSGGTVIFSDNFNDQNFTGWTITGSPTIAPNVNDSLSPSTLYVSADMYIPAANYTAMVANGTVYKHNVLGIVADGDDAPDDAQNVIAIYRSSSTLYWNDWFEFWETTTYPITPDTWYTIELAIRPGTVDDW